MDDYCQPPRCGRTGTGGGCGHFSEVRGGGGEGLPGVQSTKCEDFDERKAGRVETVLSSPSSVFRPGFGRAFCWPKSVSQVVSGTQEVGILDVPWCLRQHTVVRHLPCEGKMPSRQQAGAGVTGT